VGCSVRHRRPDCGRSPQLDWSFWPTEDTPLPLIHTFHSCLCTLLASQRHISRQGSGTCSPLRSSYFLPSPTTRYRWVSSVPEGPSGSQSRFLLARVSSRLYRERSLSPCGCPPLSARADLSRPLPPPEKPLIPIINRNDAVCGESLSSFLTFSTAVDASVDKRYVIPGKGRYLHSETNPVEEGFSR
jgi:hypothetical protein